MFTLRPLPKEKALSFPPECVIRSGERNVVFVTRENNKFTPSEVTLGMTIDEGKVQILTGLARARQQTRQFLIDSESKLKEAVQKMLEAKKVKTEKDKGGEEDFFDDME